MTIGKFVLACAYLTGTAKLHALADDPPQGPTIVVFGDSTTAMNESFPVYGSLLESELTRRYGAPVKVINAGVKGNTTEAAAKRFDADVIAHRPDLVVIQFGINDATTDVWKIPPATEPRVRLRQFSGNLKNFVQALQRENVAVVLMTPNPLQWTPRLVELYGKPPYDVSDPDGLNLNLKTYADEIRRLGAECGVPVVDVMAAHRNRLPTDPPWLSDGMHPNQPGHEIVAERLVDLITRGHLLRREGR